VNISSTEYSRLWWSEKKFFCCFKRNWYCFIYFCVYGRASDIYICLSVLPTRIRGAILPSCL